MFKSLLNAVSGVLEFSKTKRKARGLLLSHAQALQEVDALRDAQRQSVTAVLSAHKKALFKAKLATLKAMGIKELWRYDADVGALMKAGFVTVHDLIVASATAPLEDTIQISDIKLRERTGMANGSAIAAMRAIQRLFPEIEAKTRVRIDPDNLGKAELELLEAVARYTNIRRDLPASIQKVEEKSAQLAEGIDWIGNQLRSPSLRFNKAGQQELAEYCDTLDPHVDQLRSMSVAERSVLSWLPSEGPDEVRRRFSDNNAWFYAALDSLVPPPITGRFSPATGTPPPVVPPNPSSSAGTTKPQTTTSQPKIGKKGGGKKRDEQDEDPNRPKLRPSPPAGPKPFDWGPAPPEEDEAEEKDGLEQIEFEPLPEASADSDHGHVPLQIAQAVEALELQRGPLKADLRRYQMFGAQFMIHQQRTLLGDDMGLGKTVQALAAMCHLYAMGKRHFLVVAPNSVLINWEREVSHHTELKPFVLHGAGKLYRLDVWKANGGVAITTYDSLHTLSASMDKIDMLTVDEAHKVKKPTTKRTQIVKATSIKATYVALMSGTALENRLSELHALVCLAQPSLKGTADYLISSDRPSPEEARRRIAAAYLRRTQEDVLNELPEMTKVDEIVELSAAERNSDEALKGHIQNQRIATTIGTGDGTSAKYERLQELLEHYQKTQEKVIIFSAFREVLSDVSRICGGCEQIVGEVSPGERMKMIDRLKAKRGFGCLALQVEAGGQGLNIQFARVVILMEPQFKPSTENQAIARVHRMGQGRKVIVHRLIAKDSIDEDLVLLIAHKQAIFDTYAHQSAIKDESTMSVDGSTVQQEILDELKAREEERQRRRAAGGDQAAASA
jgi:superfamily II DNA or RNA helicase